MAGEKVLVIEDKLEMVQILTDYVLGPQGYVALTALDGEEGLRMALSEEPDLVILDLKMPKMSGLQVLRTLRELQCPVPVIVITAYGSEEVVVRTLRLGANDYVAKPFELDEMINVIERVLSKSRREKERTQLLKELKKSEKELTKKIELILQGIDEGVFTVDRELRILTFDPAAERILGWREEEVIGRSCAEIFREKDGESSYQEELLLEAMRKVQLVISAEEGYPVISKDDQQIFIASSVFPSMDLDGQVIGAMAAFRDVSAEKALGDRQAARTRQAIERKFNPYISGGPVREPDMFFGREELLKRIINTLHNNSIMIHGPRRIGKTSLLYQLAARLRATPDPDYTFIPALIDLEGTAQEEFFHTLMEEILEDCQPYVTERLPLVYNEKHEKAYTHRDFARDLRTLIDHLQRNSDKEVRLILLLDEVDVMNRYDQLVQQQLRRIFMKTFARNLGAVVAGVHISKEWERLESPWYNLFLEMELPPLSREETVRLIKEPVKSIYSYEDEAVEAIWEYSQGHPQLVQQLCLEAVNQLLQEKRSRVTKADVESVYREIATWEKAQEEREERERARPLIKRVAEEGPTYKAEEGTDVRRGDK